MGEECMCMQPMYAHSVCVYLYTYLWNTCVTVLIIYLPTLSSLYQKMHVIHLCVHICEKSLHSLFQIIQENMKLVYKPVWREKQKRHPMSFLIWVWHNLRDKIIQWYIYKRWKFAENTQNILGKPFIWSKDSESYQSCVIIYGVSGKTEIRGQFSWRLA